MNSVFQKTLILVFLFSSLFVRSQTSIKQIDGLESITFHEVTGGWNQHTFDIESFELNNRFPGHMDGSNNDFEGWVNNESYDVFISDADGTFNIDGAFITIEATFHLSAASGGLNIAEISYNYDDGTSMYGSCISSYQALGASYVANSEMNVADCDLTTFSTMGHTSPFNPAKLRVTVGLYDQESEILYSGCSGDGYSVEVNGITYDENQPQGTETLSAMNGCDSTVFVNLSFYPYNEHLITYAGCEGDGYYFEINGNVYDESNPIGYELYTNQYGCDSIIFVDLIFEKNETTYINYSGCQGDGYEISINEIIYNELNPSGIEFLSNIFGCDSIVYIDLMFDTIISQEIVYQGCENDGYSISVNGSVYDQYNPDGLETLFSNNDCDTLVAIKLTFQPGVTVQNTFDRCLNDGFTVNVGNSQYDQANPSGIDTLYSIFGCDSVIVTDIRFKAFGLDTIEHTVCSGSGFSLQLGNQTFDEYHPAGDVTFISAEGCDSIIHVELDFKAIFYHSNTFQRCKDDGFYTEVGNNIYNQLNPFGIDTLTSSNGCDSIVTTSLYFNDSVLDTIKYSGCQNDGFSIVVNGKIYNEQDPVGVEILKSVNNCDSVLYINLRFIEATDTTILLSACKGDGFFYQVGNSIYNENYPSGVDTLISVVGCDSIIHTSIHFSDYYRDTIYYKGCQGDGFSFVFNGNTYNESLPYGLDTIKNEFGCDSIILIDFYFAPVKSSFIVFDGCENHDFEVNVNNVWYNKGNPKGMELLKTTEGCDSLVYIDLNYNPTYNIDFEASGCNGDGQEYTINGTKYDENNKVGSENLLTINGCDSIINVQLTFYDHKSHTISYEGCSGDEYAVTVNNSLYNEFHTKGTEVMETVNGCDSIIYISLEFRECDSLDNELCTLIVPNVFTPNGDRINDEFSVFVMKNCEILSFSIDIFDRWGNLVFNSQDPNFKWDGTKGEQNVLDGVYAYIIQFISGEEDEKIIFGDLTIIH